MGTSLSVSPMLWNNVHEHKQRSLSRPRLIVTAFGFKLLKQKNGKKVNPQTPQHQTTRLGDDLKAPSKICPARSGEIRTPSQKLEETKLPGNKHLEHVQSNQPTRQFSTCPDHFIVQASTGELLLCLGRFMRHRCLKISDLTSNEVIGWIRSVDRTLLMQGWQEEGFLTPPILVFVYLLCRDTVSEDITSPGELHGVFLTCLYLTYSYLGPEILYPLQPFISNDNKDVFWQQALDIISKLSSEMLRINTDPQFFTEVLQELKNEGELKRSGLIS